MNRIQLLFFHCCKQVIIWTYLTTSLHADVTFQLDTLITNPGSDLQIALKVKNFNDVQGFQFGMQWDATKCTFQQCDQFNLNALTIGSFNTGSVAQGWLSCLWFDPTLNGISIPDGTVICTFFFHVESNASGICPIEFIDTPVPCEVYTLNSNGLDAGFEKIPGWIKIITGAIQFSFQDTIVGQNTTFCSPWYLDGNLDVKSIAGTIQWDPSIIQFQNIETGQLDGFGPASTITNLVSTGALLIHWKSPNGFTSITGKKLIGNICFSAIGPESAMTSLDFNGNYLEKEVINSASLLSQSFTQKGKITIAHGNLQWLMEPIILQKNNTTCKVLQLKNGDGVTSFITELSIQSNEVQLNNFDILLTGLTINAVPGNPQKYHLEYQGPPVIGNNIQTIGNFCWNSIPNTPLESSLTIGSQMDQVIYQDTLITQGGMDHKTIPIYLYPSSGYFQSNSKSVQTGSSFDLAIDYIASKGIQKMNTVYSWDPLVFQVKQVTSDLPLFDPSMITITNNSVVLNWESVVPIDVDSLKEFIVLHCTAIGAPGTSTNVILQQSTSQHYLFPSYPIQNNWTTVPSISILGSSIQLSDQTTNCYCAGDASGSIELKVSGGYPPYSYQWADGNDSAVRINLKEGVYQVVIKDSSIPVNTIEKKYTITAEHPIPVIHGDSLFYFHCPLFGISTPQMIQSEGFATVQWKSANLSPIDGSTTSSPIMHSPGEYQIIASDLSSGCFSSKSIQVIDDRPVINITNALPEKTCQPNLPTPNFTLINYSMDWYVGNIKKSGTEIQFPSSGNWPVNYLLYDQNCPEVKRDTLWVQYIEMPDLTSDTIQCTLDTNQVILNPMLNDQISALYTIQYFLPHHLGSTFFQNASDELVINNHDGITGAFTIPYTICSSICCDTSFIQCTILPSDKIPNTLRWIQNTITPDENGLNDQFDISKNILEDPVTGWPEFALYNQQGKLVFHEKEYKDQFTGLDQNGNELSSGTYYYILTMNKSQGKIYRGDLNIVRNH